MNFEGQSIYQCIAKYTSVNQYGGDPTKQSKAITKETTANIEVRYCPYCGRSNVSFSKEGVLCLSCGSSFMTSKILQDPARALDKVLNGLGVPPTVRDSARAIYRRAVARVPPLVERAARALGSAAIYAAYKKNGLTKSVDEIAAASGVEKTETENYYTFLLNEMGYLSSTLNRHEAQAIIEPEDARWEVNQTAGREEGTKVYYVERFLEKKGTYEFLRILKESPKRWKTLEKELALSPRTLSERITQALELGFIEKIRRLKIGATYYRLTRRGNEILEAMTENTSIY